MKLNFLSKQKTSHLFAHLLVTSVLVLHNSHPKYKSRLERQLSVTT